MVKGIIGKKVGMTQLFDANGKCGRTVGQISGGAGGDSRGVCT